ncbi:MAG: class I SAM-dependent methyltransferase [Deltaproteobacteria bacterium]
MGSPTEVACRLCGNRTGNHLHTAREMMNGTREPFEYVECGACRCLHIREVPANLGDHYGEGYYSLGDEVGHLGWAERMLRRRRAAHLFGRLDPIGWLVSRVMGPGHYAGWFRRAGVGFDSAIADVGCGSGSLLHLLRSDGFRNLTGIDPFVPSPVQLPGLRIVRSELPAVNGTFDLVMAHHSLEHVADPLQALRDMRAHLRPGGTLLVRIPIAGCWAWRHYGVDWVQLDAPRHLCIPSEEGFRALAAKAGLEITHSEYDSTALQFWGSEQYREGVPMHAPNSYSRNPEASRFDAAAIRDFQARARRLNEQRDGDQACFFLRSAG